MDRGKLGGPRKTKPKGPPPTGELIALGSKPTPGLVTDPKLPSQQRKASGTSSTLMPSSSSAFAAKKPKLGVLTPLGRPAEGPKKPLVPARESSVAPILVPASELIDAILDAEAENNDDRVDSLIVGAINTLKSNKAKPDQGVFLSLMFLAKTKPLIFLSEGVTESFCSLLKRDVSFNFKSKGNPLVVVLTCNILMSAYQEEDNWPDNFVKVFVEDSLGERVWVDNPECREFVANIQTAFSTKLPPKSGLTPDLGSRPPSSTPEHCPSPTQFGDDDDKSSDVSEGLTTSERLTPDDQTITPRYTFMQESIEGYILDTLKDQLTRRQAMDNLSRNLIRLMTVTCGYAELTRPAQELLMSVCLNCVTQDPQDVEVVSALIRVRLKTKPLINHYNSCMRELLNAHPENLSLVLKHTIYNELSNSRNPNNMSLLAVLFQHSPEEAAKYLAVVFQELLTNREDYLRAVRALLREIIRALRGDLNFAAFCRSLMQERSEPQFTDMEGHLKSHAGALRTTVHGHGRSSQDCDAIPRHVSAFRISDWLLRPLLAAGDLNFAAFCRSLMQERSEPQFIDMEGHLKERSEPQFTDMEGHLKERSEPQFIDMEGHLKERLLLQLTDLICLGCLLSVTAAVKEAASAVSRGDKKDVETLRRFQLQSSVIQRDSVWWLHTIAPGMFKLNSTDYVQCIQKVLFMESAESYYSKDNWPPEGERAYLLRLVSEVPVQEDTLMRLLVIGLYLLRLVSEVPVQEDTLMRLLVIGLYLLRLVSEVPVQEDTLMRLLVIGLYLLRLVSEVPVQEDTLMRLLVIGLYLLRLVSEVPVQEDTLMRLLVIGLYLLRLVSEVPVQEDTLMRLLVIGLYLLRLVSEVPVQEDTLMRLLVIGLYLLRLVSEVPVQEDTLMRLLVIGLYLLRLVSEVPVQEDTLMRLLVIGLYLLRLVSEVPVQEDTLMRLLVIGLSRDLPLSAVEALDLADQVVRRAASLQSPDFDVLPVERLQLLDAVLNLCAYHHPENIQLPQGYEPPTLAISNLYWKGWMLLLTVSAFNPANIGHAAWEHYPQLKCFMEMVMTNDYDWPPGTLATEEKKAELINKELQICELEKQEILEFESHLAAASTKVSITEANSLLISQLISMDPRYVNSLLISQLISMDPRYVNSLLISQLISMDPSGVARRPPPSILQQLRSLNKSLKLGHLLCRCRNPDFLLDIIQRQGTSQSMPWLAELVESSEGSMEVLPVQCLCEFLLHDIGEEAAEQEDEELQEMERTRAEGDRLKQKSRKQDQLRRRLQTLLYGPDSQPNETHEVLQYFLRRLGSQQRAARNLAARALSMLLSPRAPPRPRSSKDSSTSEAPELDKETAAVEEEDVVTMVTEDGLGACPPELKGFHWLLVELPKLPHFGIVLATTVYALRQACQTETDPMAVSAYMLFLSQHAPPVVSDMADLALDMATVIVERPTIISHLMPRGVGGRDEADIAFCALLAIYIQYFKMVLQPQGEPAWGNSDWFTLHYSTGVAAIDSESQDQIFLRWSTGEGATMHILVVHAMIILLTYGEPRGENEYSWLLEVWFPIQGQPPAAYLVDTSEEALLLPDWLKLRMIRSHVQRLVDAALLDLDPAQLVLFVQSFGIPMDSMSKLLICLDEAVTHNPLAMQQAVVDKDPSYMSQLVEVQHMRGVVGGEKFKAFLNDHGSLSTGAVADVEMISPVEEERGLSRRPQPSYRPPSTEAGWMQEIVKLFPVDPGAQVTSAMKKDIVKGIQLGLSKEISSVTRGEERRDSLGDVLIATILQLCGGDYSIPFTSSLHQNSHLSCPIFRLLMARENVLRKKGQSSGFPALVSRLVKYHSSRGTLTTVLKQYHRQLAPVQKDINVPQQQGYPDHGTEAVPQTTGPGTEGHQCSRGTLTTVLKQYHGQLAPVQKDINVLSALQAVLEAPYQHQQNLVRQAIAAVKHADPSQPLDFSLVHRVCGLLCRFTSPLLEEFLVACLTLGLRLAPGDAGKGEVMTPGLRSPAGDAGKGEVVTPGLRSPPGDAGKGEAVTPNHTQLLARMLMEQRGVSAAGGRGVGLEKKVVTTEKYDGTQATEAPHRTLELSTVQTHKCCKGQHVPGPIAGVRAARGLVGDVGHRDRVHLSGASATPPILTRRRRQRNATLPARFTYSSDKLRHAAQTNYDTLHRCTDFLLQGQDRDRQPYLLALLTHQTNYDTLHRCTDFLLQGQDRDRINSTAALDFLWACIHIPKVWQGRDTKVPQDFLKNRPEWPECDTWLNK
ncbi:Integrator complex subunit 1 [Branchiostoma belcheri]|nr:Integrator complex subunit 1 [Branchiostoma belcheri]